MQTPIERITDAIDKNDGERIMLNVRDVKLLLIERKTWQDYAQRAIGEAAYGRG